MPSASALRRALGPLPVELPDAMLLAVYAAYQEPPRVYHTFAHAAEVLEQTRRFSWEHPVEVALAALYHDAIYVAGASDNEQRSADLAVDAVERWLCGVDTARLHRLILLTARHGSLSVGDVDPEEALFLDCDMAILAADPQVYDTYEEAVAQEYASVVDAEGWRIGRAAFLSRALSGTRIYLSEPQHERLDARARANLQRALRRLQSR